MFHLCDRKRGPTRIVIRLRRSPLRAGIILARSSRLLDRRCDPGEEALLVARCPFMIYTCPPNRSLCPTRNAQLALATHSISFLLSSCFLAPQLAAPPSGRQRLPALLPAGVSARRLCGTAPFGGGDGSLSRRQRGGRRRRLRTR